MEDSARNDLHDFNLTLASRKAEEAAWRRYEASRWLGSFVGPIGISNQPSEREFISCLRNGLVLCNAINKIHPGAVTKVVENPSALQSLNRESQPLPAYQYFENVRNFLVAVEELKLPAFEASDLERDSIEVGSAVKVVDCILALKSFHEWKKMSSGNGVYKHMKSPSVMHSASRMQSRPSYENLSDSCRLLDMSATHDNQLPLERQHGNLEEFFVKSLVNCLLEKKENINGNLLVSFHNGNMEPMHLLRTIVSSCFKEQLQEKFPELQSVIQEPLSERSSPPAHSTSKPLPDVSAVDDAKHCRSCLRKDNCSHWRIFQMQEKELLVYRSINETYKNYWKDKTDLKSLLLRTKREFEGLQYQLQSDLRDLGSQVQELSTAALGYHRVVQENRSLYNTVMDLKGNIRVYCRIRPLFTAEARNVIEFIGQDGSLVIIDPLKSQKEGKKVFRFNRVFGPTATQDEVFKDTRPLIRSVMDGYNVCIFAYGQTGSGKTYTMSGPTGGSTKHLGINYLALNDLFQIANKRKDITRYEIYVQMVEIYNEQVRDLLAENSSSTKLEIRSCTSDNGMNLPDATIHSVNSTNDVLNLMKLGELNRVVSSTAMNNRSSRSHSVLTVHVHGKDTSGSTLRSCLHLIDLAGSERVDKSEVTGDRLKEAQHINKSLSCLGDVITALAQKNSHIPYRNSKLTLLLQDSLGGHAKTLMFAHVGPEEDSFGETVSTLKFGQRVSTVELGAARLNKESSEVMQLKERLESLKKALANKEAHATLSNKIKEPRSPRQMTEKTPPRPRRLSIENCSIPKPENLKKPPANKEAQSALSNKTKDPRLPRQVAEKTPPRPRRLSIENCSITKPERATNLEDRKGYSNMPSVTTRSRRLSLEGPRHIKKDNSHIKASEDENKNPKIGDLSIQNCDKFLELVAVTKSSSYIYNGGSVLEMTCPKAPLSPTSSAYKMRVSRTDCRMQNPSLQLPKTPEPPLIHRNEVQMLMQNDPTSGDSQTPNLFSSSTKGKGSQIRRSLRTIGKLINGSEKRHQQSLMESQTPIKNAKSINDGKSAVVAANSRINRRQSLTGIPDNNRYRRSSLGGTPS